jgi:hypothetical protein
LVKILIDCAEYVRVYEDFEASIVACEDARHSGVQPINRGRITPRKPRHYTTRH